MRISHLFFFCAPVFELIYCFRSPSNAIKNVFHTRWVFFFSFSIMTACSCSIHSQRWSQHVWMSLAQWFDFIYIILCVACTVMMTIESYPARRQRRACLRGYAWQFHSVCILFFFALLNSFLWAFIHAWISMWQHQQQK